VNDALAAITLEAVVSLAALVLVVLLVWFAARWRL
jgi:hypothetical protein